MWLTPIFYWVAGFAFGVGLFAKDITLLACSAGVALCAVVLDILD